VLGKHYSGVTANSRALSSSFDLVVAGIVFAKNGVISKIMGCRVVKPEDDTAKQAIDAISISQILAVRLHGTQIR
jgi:hypothetical protein